MVWLLGCGYFADVNQTRSNTDLKQFLIVTLKNYHFYAKNNTYSGALHRRSSESMCCRYRPLPYFAAPARRVGLEYPGIPLYSRAVGLLVAQVVPDWDIANGVKGHNEHAIHVAYVEEWILPGETCQLWTTARRRRSSPCAPCLDGCAATILRRVLSGIVIWLVRRVRALMHEGVCDL